MHLAVCDDSVIFLRELEQQLWHIPIVEEVSSFSDIAMLRRSMADGARYDAVLLDIQWNTDADGLELAEELFQRSPGTRIIFVTGYADDYLQQVFLRRANLSGFLTKPVDQTLLEANLQKIAEQQQQQLEDLMLRSGGASVALPFQSICYLESRGHTVLVHTAQEEFTVYEQLHTLSARLPDSFIQCHKSFVVNMQHIHSFCAAGILLRSGARIPVSRSKFQETRTAYFSFIGSRL